MARLESRGKEKISIIFHFKQKNFNEFKPKTRKIKICILEQ